MTPREFGREGTNEGETLRWNSDELEDEARDGGSSGVVWLLRNCRVVSRSPCGMVIGDMGELDGKRGGRG